MNIKKLAKIVDGSRRKVNDIGVIFSANESLTRSDSLVKRIETLGYEVSPAWNRYGSDYLELLPFKASSKAIPGKVDRIFETLKAEVSLGENLAYQILKIFGYKSIGDNEGTYIPRNVDSSTYDFSDFVFLSGTINPLEALKNKGII